MALVKCRECGREISDQAEKCPGCGVLVNASYRKRLSKKNNSKVILAFCIIGAVMLCSSYFLKKEENLPIPANNYIRDTSQEKNTTIYNSTIDTTPLKNEREIFLDSNFLTAREDEIKNHIIDEDLKAYKNNDITAIEDILKEKYGDTKGTSLYNQYNENEVLADKNFKNKIVMITALVISVDKDFRGNALLQLKGDGGFGTISANFGPSNKAIDTLSNIKKGSVQKLICHVQGMYIKSVILDECSTSADMADKISNEWKSKNITNREMVEYLTNKKGISTTISKDNFSETLAIIVKSVSLSKNECKSYSNLESCFSDALKTMKPDSVADAIREYFHSHGIDKDNVN